jgi:AraC-like DNA-binding protein
MPVSVPESGLEIGAYSRVVKEARRGRRHSHPFFELLCVTEGHTHVVIRGRKMVAGPGDLLIYYPDEEHEECVQAGRWSLIWLRFDPKRLDKPIGFPSRETAGPLVHLPWPERFQHLFTQMLVEQRIMDPWSEVMMAGYLTQFTVLLQRAIQCLGAADSGRPPEKCSRVGMALELIHNSLDRDVSLKELASQSYMSESHFSHSFNMI